MAINTAGRVAGILALGSGALTTGAGPAVALTFDTVNQTPACPQGGKGSSGALSEITIVDLDAPAVGGVADVLALQTTGVCALFGAGDGSFVQATHLQSDEAYDVEPAPGERAALVDGLIPATGQAGHGGIELVTADPNRSLSAVTLASTDSTDFAAGQLDADGLLDFADPGTAYFRDGTSNAFGGSKASNFGQAVTIVELDGDNRKDIVTADGTSFRTLRNLGAHSFGTASPAAPLGVTGPAELGAGDLDGDGRADVIAQVPGTTIGFLHNLSTGIGDLTLTAEEPIAVGLTVRDVAVGDIDADGRPDLVVATTDGVKLLLNRSDPGRVQLSQAVDLGGVGDARAVAVGDLDGDGFADIAVNDGGVVESHLARLSHAAAALPTGLAFPGTPVGQTSPPQSVTISNPGDLPVRIEGVSAISGDAGDFLPDLAGCAGKTLRPNASCVLTVRFTPTSAAARSATLQVTTDGAGAQPTLSVSGTGSSAPTGATGATGSTGATGPTGGSGASGPAGADGAPGPQGVAGPAGATGASGGSGAEGAQGPQGVAGPAGATGPRGGSGSNGADGRDGAQTVCTSAVTATKVTITCPISGAPARGVTATVARSGKTIARGRARRHGKGVRLKVGRGKLPAGVYAVKLTWKLGSKRVIVTTRLRVA